MKRLRFVQIPKTAGSTLAYLLLRQYRGIRYFYFTGETEADTKRYRSLSEAERGEIGFYLGHAPIATGIQEADDATLITLLRDPVRRVKSFCQHVSEGKAPYLQKDFPPDSFDLDGFLNSGNYEISNLQTKMLINKVSCASPVLINSMSPAEATDKALENLFTVISRFGIQEYFDESLIHFCRFLHWKMPFYLSANLKDSKRLIEFKPRHLDRIAELNSIDLEVYAAARKKFREIIASADFDSAKLKRFKFLNPLAIPFLQLRHRIEKASRSS